MKQLSVVCRFGQLWPNEAKKRCVIKTLTFQNRTEQIELFVLGLPRELNGREGPAAKKARAFAAKLMQATPARVELYDEWLSTREAAGRLRAQPRSYTNKLPCGERDDIYYCRHLTTIPSLPVWLSDSLTLACELVHAD